MLMATHHQLGRQCNCKFVENTNLMSEKKYQLEYLLYLRIVLMKSEGNEQNKGMQLPRIQKNPHICDLPKAFLLLVMQKL